MSLINSLDLTKKPKIKRRKYAAAQYTPMTGDWTPSDGTINDEIESSLDIGRARIRQLVRDNPHFSRAVHLYSAFICGSGIRYQSQIKNDDGVLDKKLNQYIEDKFNRWMDNIDIADRLHGYEMQDLSCRQLTECGEFIRVRKIVRSSDHPVKYQMIEPDALSSLSSIDSTKNISQGIEYDPYTFKALKYYFLDDYGRQYSIKSGNLVHKFHVLRPYQLRGISDFMSGVLLADAFRNYIGSELARKAMAARWLAFVKTPDPLRYQTGADTDDDGNKLEDIENTTIQYLNPMEDITFPSPPDDAGIKDFSELILQMYSVCTGIPYEFLTQDYGSMSFATAKIKRTDFKMELKPAVSRFTRWFCESMKKDFFQYGVLSGYLELPGYWDNPDYYERCIWQPPGMEPVDQLREVKATIEEIKTGLRAPQEYIRARGGDPDEIMAMISEFKNMAESYDLDFNSALMGASTMMNEAPSKIDDDGDANEE